jgi:hypothetical protein
MGWGLRFRGPRKRRFKKTKRFALHKRALLLTAATFALLSGQAPAATTTTTMTNSCLKNTDDVTDITKKTAGPLCTSTAASGKPGDILIDTAGTVTMAKPASSTDTAFPAITIDSNNLVTEKGSLNYLATTAAIGVQLNTGNTGGFDLYSGTLDMLQGGTGKVGILVTDPTSGKYGTFTGVKMPDALTPITKRLTAIDLESGSTLEIAGDGSMGVEVATGNKVVGDIDIGGALTMTPTKTGETTNNGTDTIGVDLAGAVVGDFQVFSSGDISVTGPGAEGVVVDGKITGQFYNDGAISVVGTATPSTTKTTNPLSGSAVIIQSDITGGIVNDGPINTSGVNSSGTAVGTGSITSSGSEPAFVISPILTEVDIGPVKDATNTDKFTGTGYSLLNRGTISSVAPNPDVNTTAIHLVGSSATTKVKFTGGIFNSGSISASSTTQAQGSAITTAIALDIDDYAHVPNLVDSSQASQGSISATVTGAKPGIAEAVFVNTSGTPSSSGSLRQIDNGPGSSIEATASTTDNTNTVLEAFAIRDLSGSLDTINNDGIISATTTKLTNDDQVAEAIYAGVNSTGVTIKNGGSITGDVILGSGADTLQIGDSTDTANAGATVVGNVYFGGDLSSKAGTPDTLTINTFGSFVGQIEEPLGDLVNISVASGGSLTLTNNGTQFDNISDAGTCPSQPQSCGVQADNFTTDRGSNLTIDVAQIFNQNGTTTNPPPVIGANKASIASGTNFSIGYGSFINAVGKGGDSQFILVGTPTGDLTIGSISSLQHDVTDETPFLFNGSLCTVNVAGAASAACSTVPKGVTGSALVLQLDPKCATAGVNGCTKENALGLHGFAESMFDHANAALANDTTLGAAVISAGLPVNGKALTAGEGSQLYQNIYSQFAPDVTGSARAIAISLTDQGTGEVGARQRALRMYAGQDGDTTLWGQEFTQNLNVGNKTEAGGYDNTGFGFVLGADGGNPRNGRYGAAFQFYSGDTHEKSPRTDTTNSEWLMLSGYTDWRGRGFFFDSQASIGYAQLRGQRFINVGQTADLVSRDARGDRTGEFLSGGATAGVILAAGGTVFTPQVSVDGLTMRQEGYTETSSTATAVVLPAEDGFDLTVKPNYSDSARVFVGADVRQDLNFGGFYLQPEARAGYRYDFIDGAEKVKAAFVSQDSDPANYFTITGPDPARGNFVLGGGLATTTGAWSVGVNYDYVRGVGGTKTLDQIGTFTIVGRM